MGFPQPVIVSHLDILRDVSVLDSIANEPFLVRLDSVGEDQSVEHKLLDLGYPEVKTGHVAHIRPNRLAQYDHQYGEVLCPRQFHCGYEKYLQQLASVFEQKSRWRILNSPDSIRQLFDKRTLLPKYQKLGLPIADTLQQTSGETISSVVELKSAMLTNRWEKVYIKLSCGSSASCLAIYQFTENQSERLITTLLNRNNKWFNSLKVQRLDDPQKINRVIRFLLGEGSRIEKAMPKAKLNNAYMDLRILIINGEPCFTLVRQNTHPITNLHLGGTRGDLQQFLQRVDVGEWEKVLRTCRKIAATHDSFQIGVDIMFEPGFKTHRVIEANAFGDLLPNLRKKGLSVYAYQINEATRQ